LEEINNKLGKGFGWKTDRDRPHEIAIFLCKDNIIRVIKSKRIRWAGHMARKGDRRSAKRVLVGRCEGKKPLGRPRRSWKDNIKMDLQEVEWDQGLD
jgi:hypothetical protein